MAFTSSSLRWGIVLLGGLWGLFPLGAAPAEEGASSPPGGTLAVQVVVPPTWQPLLDEPISDALVERIRDVFHRAGYAGDVRKLGRLDEPAAGEPLLSLNLIEWRLGRTGMVQCTFSAALSAGKVIKTFGLLTGTAINGLDGPGAYGLSRSYLDAADDAVQQLCRAAARTELLPGLRRR